MIERQTAETRFRELLESAPDAVVLVDAQGKIKLVNRRTAELFGYEPHELIDREVELLVPNRFRAGHLPHRAGYVANPRTREMGAMGSPWYISGCPRLWFRRDESLPTRDQSAQRSSVRRRHDR